LIAEASTAFCSGNVACAVPSVVNLEKAGSLQVNPGNTAIQSGEYSDNANANMCPSVFSVTQFTSWKSNPA